MVGSELGNGRWGIIGVSSVSYAADTVLSAAMGWFGVVEVDASRNHCPVWVTWRDDGGPEAWPAEWCGDMARVDSTGGFGPIGVDPGPQTEERATATGKGIKQ